MTDPTMIRLRYLGMAHLLARVSKHIPEYSDDLDCIHLALCDAAKELDMEVKRSGNGGWYLESKGGSDGM